MQAMHRTSTIEPCQCQLRSCETNTKKTAMEMSDLARKGCVRAEKTTNTDRENLPRGKTAADNLHASTRQSSAKCREHARIPNTKHRSVRKSVFRWTSYR